MHARDRNWAVDLVVINLGHACCGPALKQLKLAADAKKEMATLYQSAPLDWHDMKMLSGPWWDPPMEVSNDLTFDVSHITHDAGARHETWAVKLMSTFFFFFGLILY